MLAVGRLGHVGTVRVILGHAGQGDGVSLGFEHGLQGRRHGQSLLATGKVDDRQAVVEALFSHQLEQRQRAMLGEICRRFLVENIQPYLLHEAFFVYESDGDGVTVPKQPGHVIPGEPFRGLRR